jgi:hypothetical protein
MTVKEAHTVLSKLIEDGHGDIKLYTDYVEEGGEARGFYLSNTSDYNYDCGELSIVPFDTPIVLINSHH